MSKWIVAKPGVLGGKPCIRGTRVSVDCILDLVASGASVTAIVQAYPDLPAEGVRAAVEHALSCSKEGHGELPSESFVPTRIVLDDEGFEHFVSLLEEPAEPIPALRELLHGR